MILFSSCHHQIKHCLLNNPNTLFRIILNIFSPKPNNCPSISQQFFINPIITFPVSRYFINPIFCITTFLQPWLKNLPILAMKKFSVTKYRYLRLYNSYIRFSWNISTVLRYLYPLFHKALRNMTSIHVSLDLICCIFLCLCAFVRLSISFPLKITTLQFSVNYLPIRELSANIALSYS